MSRTIKTEVFKYSELSDDAKQKAREYFASQVFSDSCDWEHVYEDAKQIASLFGLDIDKIYFSGFWSQGDGACFEGSYRYARGALKAVKAYAPKDAEVSRIVKGLQDVQRKNFYRLYASCKHHGHYYHAYCMAVDVEDNENRYRDIGESESDITELLRDFANWIYSQLEKEHDYQCSDEAIEENINANDYEFNEDGKIV